MPQHISPPYDVNALNFKQREIYDIILKELQNTQSTTTLYYVDGPGGTGKTTLYNTIAASLAPQGYKVKNIKFLFFNHFFFTFLSYFYYIFLSL